MCSAFKPGCGYNYSTIIFIGDMYCPNTKCSGKLCMDRKSLQNRGRSVYQCPQSASVCQVRIIRFRDQTNSFFMSFGRGFSFLKRVQNRIKMSLQMSFVHLVGKNWEVLYQQRETRIPWQFCKNSAIHFGCGKCGAWLFVHKVPFTLSEHVKPTKTDKTHLFLSFC